MEKLVIPAPLLTDLREAVLREDGHEWFAFICCGLSNGRFLATDLRPVPEEEHMTKARGGCRVEPEVELSFLDECVGQAGKVPLLVHSHPFHSGAGVGFSHLDAEMMEAMTQWLANAYPDRGVGPLFAVVGQDSIRVGRYDREAGSEHRLDNIEELPVEVVGEWALERPLLRTTPQTPQSGDQPARRRHDRTVRALSEDGQARLADAEVAVVSAGGIGSHLVEQLSRLGVGSLVVIDPDVVETSNLSRLYGATHADVGRAKVEVMAEHATAIDPEVAIETYEAPVQEVGDRLTEVDLIVAGVDRISARMWLNEFAVRHLIPYVDAGVVIRTDESGTDLEAMEGIVQTIIPGVTGCFACLDRGDPEQARIERLTAEELEAEVEDGYVEDSALTPEPAVIHLNSVIAGTAIDTVVRILTGVAAPAGLVRFEGLNHELDGFETNPATGCVVCSTATLLGRGVTSHHPDQTAAHVDEIDPAPLDDSLAAAAAEQVDVPVGAADQGDQSANTPSDAEADPDGDEQEPPRADPTDPAAADGDERSRPEGEAAAASTRSGGRHPLSSPFGAVGRVVPTLGLPALSELANVGDSTGTDEPEHGAEEQDGTAAGTQPEVE